jgi:hypothetical protein
MVSPKPPDPYATADAQARVSSNAANENAIRTNPNLITPQGSSMWTQSGTETVNGQKVPRYTQTISLSPEQQQLYNQQTRIGKNVNDIALSQLNTLGNTLATPLSFDGVTQMADVPSYSRAPAGPQLGVADYNNVGNGPRLGEVAALPKLERLPANSYETSRRQVEDALYSRLNPQLQQSRDALEQRLRNQGLTPGTEAYNRAVDESNRAANDARMQVVLAGGNEQSRLAGLDLSRIGQRNQATEAETASRIAQQQYGNQIAQQQYQNETAATQYNNQSAAQRMAALNAAQQQMYDNAVAGTQYNNTLLGQEAAAQNQMRQQQIAERQTLRSTPIAELGYLTGMGNYSGPSVQSYNASAVAPPDLAGLIGQNYQTKANQYNALLGGLAGIGGSILKAPMTGGGSVAGNMLGGLAGLFR